MSSVDEPIFEAEESGEQAAYFDVPDSFHYVGAVAEGAIPSEFPTLYFDWEVARTLQAEAQRSTKEDREVAGILLGTTSKDNQIIKVSHIAIARDEDSSPVHFKFTYSVWDDLIDQMERFSRKAGESLLLLGWYHTHPNMAVFLSRYDLRTHRDFHRPYQFALVLAPKLGTAETSVGFFVNRGEGTPLLPGLRLYGAPERKEVAGQLPWRFQVVEAEGIEEGEGDEKGAETKEEDRAPVLHQLGVVRMEDPEWLTLGDDPSEGPVLPILEGMAAAVVEARVDRLGVLLGTKTPDNHITITRVRFLGNLAADPSKEREELLGALRFMAQTFPAAAAQKILGVVRVVSPHQFRAGDSYDPIQHNIRIAQFLGEVGYDLDQVPFQVGLVLYPGVEEDLLYFQVFAQHKSSRPVPLMSLQAVAPPSLRPNERYEPVEGAVFEIQQTPCMKAPTRVPASRIGAGASSARLKPVPSVMDGAGPAELGPGSALGVAVPGAASAAPLGGAGAGVGTQTGGGATSASPSGADWDSLPEEEAGTGGARSRLPVMLVLLLAVALLVAGALRFVGQKDGDSAGAGDPAGAAPGTESGGAAGPDAAGASGEPLELELDVGAPYAYSIIGCGRAWNPAVTCRPFDGVPPRRELVDLVRLRRSPSYLQATMEPIEAWLVPEAGSGRSRLRLERRGEGEEAYVFSVGRAQGGWAEFWGAGGDFGAELVIAPRGADLVGDDELSALRRREMLRIAGPATGRGIEDGDGEGLPLGASSGGGRDARAGGAAPSGGRNDRWTWKSGGLKESARWDRGKRVIDGALLAIGGSDAQGSWRLGYLETRDGAPLRTNDVKNPTTKAGVVDLTRPLTDLLRSAEATASIEKRVKKGGASVWATISPPRGGSPLTLEIALTAAEGVGAGAAAVTHKVCVMIAGPDGAGVAGEAWIQGGEEGMRPTFDPSAGGKAECEDGGASSRWRKAEFGPGRATLEWFAHGGAGVSATPRESPNSIPLDESLSRGAAKCLAITAYSNAQGRQSRAPSVAAMYELVDGQCRRK
jgi:proteasome lid subunit RPN8/RPN11